MEKDTDFNQIKLERLKQSLENATAQYLGTLDQDDKDTLEFKIKAIEKEIEEVRAEQTQDKFNRVLRVARESRIALADVIRAYENQQKDCIISAYQQTAVNWILGAGLEVNSINDILGQLEKIARGKLSYTAQEEFIARLVAETSEASLASDLKQWGETYCDGRDWLSLYAQIQAAQEKRLEKAQPAIFITITRSDEASTQDQAGETFYQMDAWLVEDIETYQKCKTGYYSLIASGSADVEPCLLADLLEAVPRFMEHCLAQKNQHCSSCQNYPEIHVFLPLELMHLGVEVWQLNSVQGRRANCLGHDHIVVVRCANRYDRNYSKAPSWRRLWNDRYHPSRLGKAQTVFMSGNDEDLDGLIDLLDEAVEEEDKSIMGLYLTQAPIDTEAMCYGLLDSGLPLAIWPRENLLNNVHEVDLPALLGTCCLEELPQGVQRKRYETRKSKNKPGSHIGHHLSLLWDNPHLVPPKSA
jgi:vWA-MoxR associated protein C-terminal domain/vWA-MoxR associated protein middle region (VMAP-M) 1